MRFLFLFSDTGGGHRAAAQAVSSELQRLYGNAVQVELLDFFKALGRWPFPHFPGWYPTMVKYHGIPWGIGYHLTDRQHSVKTLSRLAWPYAGPAIRRMLARHPADVIVSFHAVVNYSLQMALQRRGRRIPLATVVLDLVSIHAAWFAPDYDLYVVPTDEARTRALACGAASERTLVAGMPTRHCFSAATQLSPSEARACLGLSPRQPLILLMGGGEGMGPLEPVIRAIAARRPPAQLVAITGNNRALYRRLTRLDLPAPLRVEGFVPDMEIWMRAADLLVTKAGPNTLAEAFITGLPVILYDAIPGQEEGNVSYLVEHGAGLWAPHPRQVATAVTVLLADTPRRQTLAAHARRLARPQATETIARRLWQLGARRD
ncbi:MAG: galactosyldiacylglycerol synthase [Chloroflexi bacterium]|nr:MAG: galactosyldiacylglycerol synthase [Chloroflexota bacterium]